jgi:hypothetical protein
MVRHQIVLSFLAALALLGAAIVRAQSPAPAAPIQSPDTVVVNSR